MMKTVKNVQIILLALAAITVVGNSALAVMVPQIIFDKTNYVVNAGEAFDVQILFDADNATAGLQPLSGGLFSIGVKITFDGAKLALLNGTTSDIVQENPPFDGDGTGGAPFKEVGTGYAAVAAAMPLSATEYYTGSHLVTFHMKNLSASAIAPTTLNAALCYANKANFVDSQGATLDSQIVLGSASVPEPATMILLGLGSLITLRRKA